MQPDQETEKHNNTDKVDFLIDSALPSKHENTGDEEQSSRAIIRSLRFRHLLYIAVLIVAITTGIILIALHKQGITNKQIAYANTSAQKLQTDYELSVSDIIAAQNSTSLNEFDKSIDASYTNLSNAQTQYMSIKQSHVLSNLIVEHSFKTFSNKWLTYYSYLKNMISDNKALYSPFITYNTQFDALVNAQTTSYSQSQLDALINSLNQDTTATLNQIGPLNELNPDDIQVLNTLISMLTNINNDLNSAANYANSSNLANSAKSVNSAETTFELGAAQTAQDITTGDNILTKINPKVPLDEFVGKLNSLD